MNGEEPNRRNRRLADARRGRPAQNRERSRSPIERLPEAENVGEGVQLIEPGLFIPDDLDFEQNLPDDLQLDLLDPNVAFIARHDVEGHENRGPMPDVEMERLAGEEGVADQWARDHWPNAGSRQPLGKLDQNRKA